MSMDANAYVRMRRQVAFLISMVELLVTSIDAETPIARAAARATAMARTAIGAIEQSAEVYASIASEFSEVLSRVELLKAQGGPPSHVEWESLRADLEAASRRIAVAAAAD